MTTDPLHVAHVSENISRLAYGVGDVMWGFASAGVAHGLRPIVVGVEDPYVGEDTAGRPGVCVHTAPVKGPEVLAYAPGVERILRRKPQLDLVHMHGMWTLVGRHARLAAQARRIPFILSTHGMLEPAARAHRGWRKRVAMALWEGRNLGAAAFIHATADREAEGLRRAGVARPIAVIGNGVDPEAYLTVADRGLLERQWPQLAGRKLLLFLGRIHEVKGPRYLVRAWAGLAQDHPDWALVIAGPDDQNHRALVEADLRAGGAAADQVTFTGPVYGQLKPHLLAAASLFVQPSLTENFGITVIESLISGAPVVTTTGTPWAELETLGCGERTELGASPEPTEAGVAALSDALRRWMAMDDASRAAAGAAGRELVLRRYTWPAVTARLAEAYRWALGGGEPPACIHAPGRRATGR